MSDKLPDDFIRRYLVYTDNHESPIQFHKWVAAGIIGACMGRKIYLNWGHFKIYPNNYIILCAGSADCRKSSALDMGVDFLRDFTDSKIFAGKITLQAIYQDMSIRKVDGRDALIHEDEVCTPLVIHADELGVFMSREAQQSDMPLTLAAIYTNPRHHDYRTKTAGTNIMREPSLNILSSTTPAWIQRNLTADTFEEGLVGRSLFIYAKAPKRRITRHALTADEQSLRLTMGEQLKSISMMEGEMEVTPNGLRAYDKWYQSRKEPKDEVQVISGFYGREHVHLLKLAMIFSLSSGSFPYVDDYHIESAKEAIREVGDSMSMSLRGAGADAVMMHTALVLNELKKAGTPMSTQQLGKNLWRNMSSAKLDEALDDLLKFNKISLHRPKGAKTSYWFLV